MNTTMLRTMVTALALLGLGTGGDVEAQTSPEQLVRLADGVVLALSVEGADDVREARPDVGARARNGELHRLLVDQHQVARFAYALSVEPSGEGAALVVRPVRLHETLRTQATDTPTYVLPFRLDGPVGTLDQVQTSGTVYAGDVIRLDTVEQRDTGARLTDVIRVVELDPVAVRALAARRVPPEDTRPTLMFAGMTLTRDGEIVDRMGSGTLATGHVLVLALPDVGTLAFSTVPATHESPVAVATVDGRTLRFTLDGRAWEATMGEPIGPPDVTSLWVYRLGGWFSPTGRADARRTWIGAHAGVDVIRKTFGARLPPYVPAQ